MTTVIFALCVDCPPEGHPTDATRCDVCPRRGPALPANVVRLHGATAPVPDARAAVALARRAIVEAFEAWLATSPDPDAVKAEIDATAQTIRHLVITAR